jgi:hypothetical protein
MTSVDYDNNDDNDNHVVTTLTMIGWMTVAIIFLVITQVFFNQFNFTKLAINFLQLFTILFVLRILISCEHLKAVIAMLNRFRAVSIVEHAKFK